MKLEVELPDGDMAALRRSPGELPGELLLAAASKWYEAGMLSQQRAAELAGCSRPEFLAALARFHVSPFQESLSELQHAATG